MRIFQNLTDKELVFLWHRLNLAPMLFNAAYKHDSSEGAGYDWAITTINPTLWTACDEECNKRHINPETGVVSIPSYNLFDNNRHKKSK